MVDPRNKAVNLILYNIRSVHNVGSIFRTADGAGVRRLYLIGTTPTPIDRFGRARKDLSKVALGAEKSVPWEHRKNISQLFRELKEQKTSIVGVEQDKRAVDSKKLRVKGSIALVIGNEVTGIPPKVLALCDTIVEIPMRGSKESLNVSVAAGIVLFALATQ